MHLGPILRAWESPFTRCTWRSLGGQPEVIWESIEPLLLTNRPKSFLWKLHLVICGVMLTSTRCLSISTTAAIPGLFQWKEIGSNQFAMYSLDSSPLYVLYVFGLFLNMFSNLRSPQRPQHQHHVGSTSTSCAGSQMSGARSWRTSNMSWPWR